MAAGRVRVLEEKMKTITKEFDEGELTEKGFKKRSLVLQKEILDAELEEGDITQKGHKRKVLDIQREIEELQKQPTHPVPPSPPKDAKKLSAYLGESSSIAATVRSLFKADKSSGTSKKRKVKESATASKKASRGSTSTQEKQKPCNSKSCSTMLTPTYFRPQGKEQFVMPKLVNPKPQKECVGTIHPTEKDHATEQFLKELNDNALLRVFEEESNSHVPDREYDEIYTEMDIKEPGEALLCTNATVEMWINARKDAGLDIPNKYDHFYIVPREMMSEFDRFRETKEFSEVNKTKQVLLQPCELLRVWMKEEQVIGGVVDFNGRTYLTFPSDMMDDLCEWVLSHRCD